jgi:hypothetical protein
MDHTDDRRQDAEADRQADERLLHALLVHMHDEQAAQHREQRVQRVMQAIRQQEEAAATVVPAVAADTTLRPHRLRLWVTRGAWAAAAMILIAVGMLVITSSSTPAMAALNDMITALGRPGDRTYHIRMEDMPEPREGRPPEENWPANMPRPGLDDARLHLRDSRQYLLVRHDPKGGLIFDGYDGRQSWRVRRGVLAEAKEGLGAGGIPMPPMMADVPFCDLQQTLEQIRKDYAAEQLDKAALSPGSPELRHVRVRRHSRAVKGPETIDIWADPETGMPTRIIFDRAKLQGNLQPCRLTLDLVSEEPLSADWFSHTAHVTKPSHEERDDLGRP